MRLTDLKVGTVYTLNVPGGPVRFSCIFIWNYGFSYGNEFGYYFELRETDAQLFMMMFKDIQGFQAL
jgi:hypothetical protein